jgi:hypothetical protein
MVGSMISLTTLVEKKLWAVEMMLFSIAGSVSRPNSGATYAKLPSIPSNSGGSDSADQKPACADSEKIESSQLLERVLRLIRQMWWRDGFAA